MAYHSNASTSRLSDSHEYGRNDGRSSEDSTDSTSEPEYLAQAKEDYRRFDDFVTIGKLSALSSLDEADATQTGSKIRCWKELEDNRSRRVDMGSLRSTIGLSLSFLLVRVISFSLLLVRLRARGEHSVSLSRCMAAR